jgi:hypothetical protein
MTWASEHDGGGSPPIERTVAADQITSTDVPVAAGLDAIMRTISGERMLQLPREPRA